MRHISVDAAHKAEREQLGRLMQDYLSELSLFTHIDQDESGAYIYPYLAAYWQDPARYPFLIRQAHQVVGFALLRADMDPLDGSRVLEIAEFYVQTPHRRTGIATEAVRHLFKLFPGEWRVAVLKGNKPGLSFWQTIVGSYTDGQYKIASNVHVGDTDIFSFENHINIADDQHA